MSDLSEAVHIIGAGGGGGGGKGGSGGSSHVATEDPDSLHSHQYAHVLDLISEGEIEGLVDGLKSVYLNDTPVQAADGSMNFTGITFAYRNGTNDQDVIPGFADTENETPVNVRLQAASPIVRAFSGNINAVRITLGIPQLTLQDTTNGDLHGSEVAVQIDVESALGGGYAPFKTETFSGKTTSRYKRSVYIPLTGSGPWNVRVTRLTADSASSALINQTWWDSSAEIVESMLSYPNSAIFGASIDAEQFSDIPSRGYKIRGIKCKVPSNYNPITRAYTGVWNGTFSAPVWTNNPVWVYYDILTNSRYGLGDHISASGIDKWALYDIAQYCDGMVPSGFGYDEPRFTANLYIQTREDAFKVLSSLTSIFRAMAYWSVGQVTVVADMPSDPVALFSNANVLDGVFRYSGSSRAARHTVALVTWNDPADMYRQTVEYVEDVEGIAAYGVNQVEVTAFGCTSRGQAHRYGEWILYTEKLETDVVAWGTGLDGLDGTTIYPGAIVKVADKHRSGDRISGRALAATINTLTLDSPVTLVADNTYTLTVTLPEGGVSDHTVTTGSGTQTVLTVTPAFPFIPQVHSIWVLASPNVVNPQTVRILTVAETSRTQAAITAIQHDPNKFAMIEYDAKFNAAIISTIKGVPDIPTNLAATDTLFDQGPGLVGIKLHFSWEGRATRFDVRWRQGADNLKTMTVSGNAADISPVREGITTLQVRGVDVLGRASAWATLNYDTLGKTALPADVSGFTATADSTGVNLKWAASPEIDVNRYELRMGSTWATATVIAEIYATALRVALRGTTTTYLIKAIDTSLNQSANAAAATVVVSAPATPTLTAVPQLFAIKFVWYFGDARQDIRGTELWWSPTTNNRADATRVTYEPFPSSTYEQIGLEPGEGGYYWIRVGDNFGNMSEWYPASATAGLHATVSTDPTALLDQLQGALGVPQLAAELSVPISLIEAPVGTAGSVNARIKVSQDALQAQINDLSNTPTYAAGTTYNLDDIVQYSGGLYRAIQTTTGNLPTNVTYWAKIGDYTSLADAVADQSAQIAAINTVTVGSTSAAASAIAGLQSSMSAAQGTLSAQATQISDRYTKAETTSAISSATTALTSAYQNADVTALNSAKTYSDAAILSEQTTRSNADSSLSTSLTTLTATVNTKNRTYWQNAAPPSGMATGDLWFDTDDNSKCYRYSGTEWVATDDARIAVNAAAIQSEVTARANAVAVVASNVTTLTSRLDTGDYAAVKTSVTASANKITGLEAKYVLQVDANGKVAGMMLASGAGGTSFSILADKFLIYRPDGTGTPKQILSLGTVNGVTALGLDGSLLVDGTVVGRSLVANTVTADKVDTRGLTIKDDLGNVILSSGTPLSTARISGLGTLATQNSVTSGQVTGLGTLATKNSVAWATDIVNKPAFGNFAYLSSINSANISTYISSAAIGNAYIANGAITYAKIGLAEIGTALIAGEAVTVPRAVTGGNGAATAATDFGGANVVVSIYCQIQCSTATQNPVITLKRNGVNIATFSCAYMPGGNVSLSGLFLDYGIGGAIYSATIGAYHQVMSLTIVALGAKR